MLLDHYKLTLQPFGVTPDPRFLYLSATHREAMASLLHGIRSERGFTALIAAPGMGKTTLLLNLLHTLKGGTKTAFLFQTLCGPREFLNALLADLGIEDDGRSITQMHAKLNEYLLRESRNGRQIVVIIDEAQNLDEQVLEVVRMLSNFETTDKKLLHLVLGGQPQLAEKLSWGSLTQLRQRISIVARLSPFNARETHDYIGHRLRVAGHASCKQLFTDQAYAMIAEQSQGVPRDINNLCFNAMSLACALKRSIVDGSMVRETINDLDLRTIVAAPKRSDEESSQAPLFSGGAFSLAEWRQSGKIAEAPGTTYEFQKKANENTPITRTVDTAGSDRESLNNILEVNPLLKDIMEHLQQIRTVKIPQNEQTTREIETVPEHNVVPFEFAAQRVMP